MNLNDQAELNLGSEHYNFLRTYDSDTGRYVEADPIGQLGGLNLFEYAASDPTNSADPSGLVKWTGTATSIGGAFLVGAGGMLVQATSECACGRRVRATIWVAGGILGAAYPLRSVGSASYGSISLDDGFACPDPLIFDGAVGLVSLQATFLPIPVRGSPPSAPAPLPQPNAPNVGAPGGGVSLTTGMIGNAFVPPQLGFIGGFGAGGGVLGGRATVVDYQFEPCEACE